MLVLCQKCIFEHVTYYRLVSGDPWPFTDPELEVLETSPDAGAVKYLSPQRIAKYSPGNGQLDKPFHQADKHHIRNVVENGGVYDRIRLQCALYS